MSTGHNQEESPLDRLIVMSCTQTTATLSRPPPKSPISKSVARVFGQANASFPQSHWDYEALSVRWGDQDRYLIDERVGRGKYSEVFSAVDTLSASSPVIIKVLKPVKTKKIKREIKILQVLYGGKNIVRLLDLVREPEMRTSAFIFEHVQNDDHRELYPMLTDHDIRYYLFELLKALEWAHSRGIMHRDVKPQNVMINHVTKTLRLIDWGLAEFYHPGTSYNCRVASRYYKGPELLVDFQEYDYSLDLWSLGCVMAGMIFEREVFFHGQDNIDQMVKILEVLGSENYQAYIDKYDIAVPNAVTAAIGGRSWPAVPLCSFAKRPDKAHGTALDLLERLLRCDHQERLTAQEAMAHPYFDPVRY